MAILRPRASRIAPSESEAIPLPREDTTPPVTNTKRVINSRQDYPSRVVAAAEGQIDDGPAGYHIGEVHTRRARRRPLGPACTDSSTQRSATASSRAPP